MSTTIVETTLTNSNVITTANSAFVNVNGASQLGLLYSIDENTPSASTSPAGRLDVDTYTTASKAGTTAGDHVVFYDTTGIPWAFALNKSGSDPEPTGALYTSVSAGRKVNVDISSATTATNVADLVRTALNALTGFTAVITLSGTATIVATQVVRGVCTDAVPYNTDQSGAGSIAVAQTTTGINSGIDVANDIITTAAAHGMPTGAKLQASSSGTLPAGLSTSTDYFPIVQSTTSFKLASSLANALAGTAINITDQGTSAATHTFTPTAIAGATYQLQGSVNDASLTAGLWCSIGSAVNITADATTGLASTVNTQALGYKYLRVAYTITAGMFTSVVYVNAYSTGTNS